MKRWLTLLALSALGLAAAAWWLKRGRTSQRSAAAVSLRAPPQRKPQPVEIALPVFERRFAQGWDDWGWGPHEIPGDGPARIDFSSYGGFILHHSGALTSRFGGVLFRYRAPAAFGAFLSVALKFEQNDETALPRVRVEPRHVANLGDGWHEVLIPWNELNPRNSHFDRIVIAALTSVERDWVLVDKVSLTKAEGRVAGPAQRNAKLEILCAEGAPRISPHIYGFSMFNWATGGTGNRVGGNPLTRLNWDLGNVWNVGSDWYFENQRGSPDTVWDWVDRAEREGMRTAMVVPMIGWVAKDTSSVGFPTAQFSPQRGHDPYRPEAGDGRSPDGKPIAPGPPTVTSVAAPPELIGSWVRRLRDKDAASGRRGIAMYILDNEPSLWNETHRDVHPEPLGYDELLDRTLRYGAAIREADPQAWIAGPAEWGWTGYFYSAKDREAGVALRPDRLAHGDVPLIPWYLMRLAEHERRTGVRILDVLNVHYYPQSEGLFGQNARTDPDSAALRIRSTRSLWDPTYTDESWIKDEVRLIPRLREWVATSYPGRKLAIGEWSFGADAHISGGLATAEALGRFGQLGLDAAYFWGGPPAGTPAFWAFRAYRNFDGHGGRFQDFSLRTRTTEDVSLFASRDETGTRVVAVLLNLDPAAELHATIDLASCGTVLKQRSFSYAAGYDALTPAAETSVRAGATELGERAKPYSITVLDLELRPARQ